MAQARSFDDTEVEIRQVFEAEDFGAEFTPELREQERTPARADGEEVSRSRSRRQEQEAGA